MTTIATSDVHAAVNRAAALILNSAGSDGIVSRKDIRTKLLSLEGTERELVDTLYRFIDRRDSARSARVTKADIDAALAFIRTELVDRFDLDNNGLSEDEVARMSELGKLAVSLARTLKSATAPTGEALSQKIGVLAKGLSFDGYYGTEGGVRIQPFHAAAKLTQLTQDALRATLKLTNRPEHEIARFESADRCLQALIHVHTDMPEYEQAEELVQFMKTHLRELHAAILGRDDPELGSEHPLYIVGIDSAGNLVGLKTGVVWT
ncbi:hypothetical protein [Stigmatella aurantiaca]|uniref:Nuclease A inhibitor-like protein n=1 Tax=Stigmatella aurantiaca (strain DW4/3-1) TaxID=378806 RepID=Q09DX0_STIAD|nr:hypothetical protein [Stigmatella aurantiaca]ADO75191.1 Nuclease A inhibitor-like protein [Stigmatella aurantiaca DW4/3-1]EAU69881.1 hypothetical protein STIAU_5555 [Stigmatella aurantiaca DW4/3-1]